jgi:hypothetical protein
LNKEISDKKMQQSRCRRTKTFDKKTKIEIFASKKTNFNRLAKKSNSHSKLLLEVLKKERKFKSS